MEAGDISISQNGSWGRAIIREVKQTVRTHWWKEMTNFNLKTVGVSFFCYFACVSPAITFGWVQLKH